LPIYFQACKGDSPVRSGVDLLPYSFSIAPFAIVAGATASVLKRYRFQNVIAWVFIMVGMGLQSTLHTNSAVRNWVGFEIIAGIGFGLLVSTVHIVMHDYEYFSEADDSLPQRPSRFLRLCPLVRVALH
jgi:hypothetical protein